VTDAYTGQNQEQTESQDAFGIQQDPQFDFPPFDLEDVQLPQQVVEQPPKLQLQLDGTYRQRSSKSHSVLSSREPPG
jgi:hypothetical protein